jgi:hypothetical protein
MATSQPRRWRRLYFQWLYQRRYDRLAAEIYAASEARARRRIRLPSVTAPRSIRRNDAPGYIYVYLATHAGILAAKIGSSNDWRRRRAEQARKCRGQHQQWVLVYATALRYRMGTFFRSFRRACL